MYLTDSHHFPFSVSEDLLCAFELLKPLDGAALRKEMTKAKRKRFVVSKSSIKETKGFSIARCNFHCCNIPWVEAEPEREQVASPSLFILHAGVSFC
jgi:hypothetical protein